MSSMAAGKGCFSAYRYVADTATAPVSWATRLQNSASLSGDPDEGAAVAVDVERAQLEDPPAAVGALKTSTRTHLPGATGRQSTQKGREKK